MKIQSNRIVLGSILCLILDACQGHTSMRGKQERLSWLHDFIKKVNLFCISLSLSLFEKAKTLSSNMAYMYLFMLVELTTTWIQRIAGPFNTSRQRWNWKVLTHKIFKHSECLEGFCGDASMYFVNRHQIQKNISNGTKYFCKSNCQLQILNFCGSSASALVQTLKNWHYHFNSPSFQALYYLFWGKGCFEKNKN